MRFFVSGTDTDVGKTIVCAWLVQHLDAAYWKPVQAGLEGETDPDTVKRLSGASADRILPCTYSLPEPLSPHEAARRADVKIDMSRFKLPAHSPLVVEGAGGLMVPLNAEALVIDLIAQLSLPVVLVARTALGTINHTVLSLEALRRRRLPVAGVVLNGDEVPHNRAAIERYGNVKVLARLPKIANPCRESLKLAKPEIPFQRWEAMAS